MKKERIKKVMELVSLCMLVNETIKHNVSFEFYGHVNKIYVKVFDKRYNNLFRTELYYNEVPTEEFNQFIDEATQGLKSFLEDTDYEISIKEKKTFKP